MQEKPAGAPPFKAHRSAYRELMENLYVATKTFQEEGDGGIEGAKLACRAVVRFVAVRHENPELAAPFLAIYKAFEDLEREIEPELFSRTKVLQRQVTFVSAETPADACKRRYGCHDDFGGGAIRETSNSYSCAAQS